MEEAWITWGCRAQEHQECMKSELGGEGDEEESELGDTSPPHRGQGRSEGSHLTLRGGREAVGGTENACPQQPREQANEERTA
jgi:hypothetical protein